MSDTGMIQRCWEHDYCEPCFYMITVVARAEVLPGKQCAVIGNRFLLQHPLKRQIQISRRISTTELASRQEELLYAPPGAAQL